MYEVIPALLSHYGAVARNTSFATVLLLVFNICSASALVRTVKSGEWHDPSIWSTMRVPKRDSIVVVDHAVTISGMVKLGGRRSRPVRHSRFRLTVRSGGVLTMAPSSKIEMNGSVLLDDAPLIMEAGSTFAFDLTSQASGTHSITIGGRHGAKNARLIVRGTSSAPASILGRAGQRGRGRAVACISDGGIYGGGNISADYLNIQGLGSTAIPAITVSTPDDYVFSLSNSRLVKSSGIRAAGQLGDRARFFLDRVVFLGSVGKYNLEIQAYNKIDADPAFGG